MSWWTCFSTCAVVGVSGPLPRGQGRLSVVPNNRQIKGRSSYASQPFGPRCTQFHCASASSCCDALRCGRRAISSEEAVTGPQQSWQPGTQAKPGICRRRCSILRWVQVMRGTCYRGRHVTCLDATCLPLSPRLLRIDDVIPLIMLLDVGGDEFALRYDPLATLANVV